MSQVAISQQDLQAIQMLTSQVMPKLIGRVKTAETVIVEMQQHIMDLQEQVKLLHTVAPKPTERKTRKKKTQPEVPELVDNAAAPAPTSAPTPVPAPAKKPQTQAELDAKWEADQAAFYGETPPVVSPPQAQPDPVVPGMPVIIDGIPIISQTIRTVRYCLSQSSDVNQIAATLGCSVNVIEHVLNLTIEEQEKIMQQFPDPVQPMQLA